MPEISRMIKSFIDLLQPYKALGFWKEDAVENHEPVIYIGNNEKGYEAHVNPIQKTIEFYEGFNSKWLGELNENIPEAAPGVLQLKVIYKNNKYYIIGKHLNLIEIFYSLPKAWHATDEIYYRAVTHNRSEDKRTVSYTDNFMNRLHLSHFQSCVNKINTSYSGKITNRLRSRTKYKILGYDTPVLFPEYIQSVIDELKMKMPGYYGTVRFGKSGSYQYIFNIEGVTNKTADEIYKTICSIYSNVYCNYLMFDAVNCENAFDFGSDLGKFLDGAASIAGLGYGDINNNDYHAKLLVKNRNKIEMYDPWIQGIKHVEIFNSLKCAIKKSTGYELVKIDRPPEQTDLEGSCVLNALCRVIAAAEGDVREKDLKEWIPVFVQMIVKHFRGTTMEESIVTTMEKSIQTLKF